MHKKFILLSLFCFVSSPVKSEVSPEQKHDIAFDQFLKDFLPEVERRLAIIYHNNRASAEYLAQKLEFSDVSDKDSIDLACARTAESIADIKQRCSQHMIKSEDAPQVKELKHLERICDDTAANIRYLIEKFETITNSHEKQHCLFLIYLYDRVMRWAAFRIMLAVNFIALDNR